MVIETTYLSLAKQIFKGCLPQNLVSPLLNTLSQLTVEVLMNFLDYSLIRNEDVISNRISVTLKQSTPFPALPDTRLFENIIARARETEFKYFQISMPP